MAEGRAGGEGLRSWREGRGTACQAHPGLMPRTVPDSHVPRWSGGLRLERVPQCSVLGHHPRSFPSIVPKTPCQKILESSLGTWLWALRPYLPCPALLRSLNWKGQPLSLVGNE